MNPESDLEIIENDSFECNDNSDDIDYEPNSKRSKRIRKTTKRFGNRESITSHDDFFKNWTQKSIINNDTSNSLETLNSNEIMNYSKGINRI